MGNSDGLPGIGLRSGGILLVPTWTSIAGAPATEMWPKAIASAMLSNCATGHGDDFSIFNAGEMPAQGVDQDQFRR